jgi:hypothetical protein
LEQVFDASEPTSMATGMGGGFQMPSAADLPSADDIAAEVERYLRDQGD